VSAQGVSAGASNRIFRAAKKRLRFEFVADEPAAIFYVVLWMQLMADFSWGLATPSNDGHLRDSRGRDILVARVFVPSTLSIVLAAAVG
jgi:hypothetical protein